MKDVMKDQAAIDAEASEWLARRSMHPHAESDKRAFRAWLAADPRHEATYSSMSRTLGDIAEMKELAALEPLDERGFTHAWRRARFSRFAIPAAALTAAAVAFLALPGALREPRDAHATEIAEIERVRLPDGSAVTLGAASEIELDFSPRERRVVLSAGEAFFEVAPDANRPFFVQAGDAFVRVVGTKFDVRRGEASVRVSVSEGIVQVRRAPRPLSVEAAPLVLRAGERVEAALRNPLFGTPSTALAIQPARADAAAAWRQGRLVYDGARLADLVADLNRYYGPGVRLADRDLGEIRLAASFRADEIDTFLSTLPSAAPVAVSRRADGEVVIGRRRD